MKLYDYQEDDLAWLLSDAREPDVALLWHALGVGKTTVAAAAGGVLAGRGWGVLVFCPAGVRTTWSERLRAWAPGRRVAVVKPGEPFRWPERGEILVAGYSLARRNWIGESSRAALECPVPCALVLDEGHVLCSRKSAQARALADVIGAVGRRGGKVWHLTATPFETSPDGLLATLQALNLLRRTWGTERAFEEHFGREEHGDGAVTWASTADSVRPRLGRYMRRLTLANVRVHLPPLRRETLLGVPRGVVRDDLDRLRALAGRTLDGAEERDVELPDDEGALAEVRVALAAAKLPWLRDVLDRLQVSIPKDERIAAYSYHAPSIGFEQAMRAREGWRVISGGSTDRARKKVMRAFQSGECHLAVTSAVATGVDLFRGNHLVRSDLSWRPLRVEAQLLGRWYRPGQTRPMHVYDLVWDHPVERAVHRVHLAKTRLFDSALSV